MKGILFIVAILTLGTTAQAQVIEEERQLTSFSKIVISPWIDVELIKSDKEFVQLEIHNIDPNDVNTRISGRTLKLFLSDAKIYVKRRKRDYRDEADVMFRTQGYSKGRVKAKVYYRDLSKIEVRGDGYLICKDVIEAERFRITAYGDLDVDLAEVRADKIKGVFYGDSKFKIENGQAYKQKYVSYGENVVIADNVESTKVKTVLYGENRVEVKASEQIKISSFGESELAFYGRPRIKRALVFGPVDYYRITAREKTN